MTDYHELNLLVDEIATGGARPRLPAEPLRELGLALAENGEFARRTAEVLLVSRVLDELSAVKAGGDLEFSPPPLGRRFARFMVPAAMLIAGLALGWSLPSRESPAPRSGAERPAVFVKIPAAPPGPFDRIDGTLALAPHHYDDGLLAGKTVEARAQPR